MVSCSKRQPYSQGQSQHLIGKVALGQISLYSVAPVPGSAQTIWCWETVAVGAPEQGRQPRVAEVGAE